MKSESGNIKTFKADMHIHTCLSPCADLDMSPRNIIKEAKTKGLDIIGICDHNSAENFPAVERSGNREGIKVIGGMEITTREEVHVLALFGSDRDLFLMQEAVYAKLHGINDEERYGLQVVVNENDEVLNFNSKLLIGATELSIEEVVKDIKAGKMVILVDDEDRENEGDLTKLMHLIRSYFKLNGHHIQFNIVDTATLLAAQQCPDDYKDLLVRMAGYSDYFNDMNADLQQEVIDRTENESF